MADAFMPEYWPANRIIGKLEKALVKAENILGLIQSAQIENLVAGKVTGLLTSAQIAEIEAAKVSGKLTSEQIESIKASQISGKLTNAQLESIEAAKITGVITETQIGPEAVTTPKLKAGAITTAKLAASSVTAEILAAGSVTTEKLVAGSVNAGALAAGSVTTAKLAAEAITAEKVGAGQILTAKLAAGAVTAEKLSVATLSAISANLGTVTAGTITGVLIESSTFKLTEKTSAETLNTVKWFNGENVKEQIYGSNTGGATVHDLGLESFGTSRNASLLVRATDNVGLNEGYVGVVVGGVPKRIINTAEESSFLQLAGLANRKIWFGTFTLTWAASTNSNAPEVTHGLTVEPIVVVCAPRTSPAFGNIPVFNIVSRTATKFTVNAETKSAFSGSITCMFLAIG